MRVKPKIDRAPGQRDADHALGAIGDRQRQRQQPRHLGQHQRHHGEIDAAQAQDRQADQHAGGGAEQAGDRQRQPERPAVGHHQNGRDVAAHQRIGALADIDPPDIEGEPDAGAGDAEQRHRGQRVVEVGPSARRDERRDEDEDATARNAARRDDLCGVCHRAVTPTACPSARCGRMLRNTIRAAKMTR